MDRLKLLIREPALLIDAFESVVVVAVALGLFGLSGEAQRDLIALFIALLALAKGFLTRPFPVTVVPDLGRAALVFFGSVGLTHLSADQITLVATMLGTVTTLLSRAQITPKYDPVTRPGGAGSGPVSNRTEAGYVASAGMAVGLALVVIGLILLLLTSYSVVGIILIVAGVLAVLFWR